MSKPESRGPGRAPLPKASVNAFFHHLGGTGSVTVAAEPAQLRRTTLYQKRQDDEEFAERWARALDLGVERLQDNAMNRAMNGTPKPVWRNGRQVGSVSCRRHWRRSAGFQARQGRRRSAVTITSAATACSAAVMPSAQL